MNELHEWLEAHRIAYRPIDREVVEIEGLGKLFLADLSGVESIFRVKGAEVEFNLMERPEVLLAEGIEYIAFPFGDNWYYYSLREGFGLNILKYVGRRVPCKRKTPFVNLGVHTPYELLNASGDVSQWVRKAVWMDHSALGICDRNTMGATLALQKACDKAGIRPVIGYTCTLAHEGEKVEVKIYCQSQRGLRNLLRIQKAVMVDAADATVPLPELLRRGEGNVLVFGKLSPFWMEKNLHAVKAIKDIFNKVFYQVDLSEYKAERLDAEVLKATAHFFHTFYDEKNDSFLVEPVLIADCYYPDKDDARTKTVLNKIATGAAHAQSDDQYFKDIDEHYAAIRALFDGERWDTDTLFERMCRHTVEIAEGAEARYQTERNYMPRYDMTAEEQQRYGDRYTMFRQLLEEGFRRLVPRERAEEYRKRERGLYPRIDRQHRLHARAVRYRELGTPKRHSRGLRARFRRRFARAVPVRHHAHRPHPVQPALRAFPAARACRALSRPGNAPDRPRAVGPCRPHPFRQRHNPSARPGRRISDCP